MIIQNYSEKSELIGDYNYTVLTLIPRLSSILCKGKELMPVHTMQAKCQPIILYEASYIQSHAVMSVSMDDEAILDDTANDLVLAAQLIHQVLPTGKNNW